MKNAISLMLAAMLVSSAASANPLEGLYGNTATSTSPDGKTYSFYFNQDGTYKMRTPGGHIVTGFITWKDAQTACFTVTDPPPKPGDTGNCRPFPVAHHVGDVWVEKDSEGVPYTNTVIAGRPSD